MLLILHSMVIQHAMPRAVRRMKFRNLYPIRRNMASACIQLFFMGIPIAVQAPDVFPPKPLKIHLVYIAPKDLHRLHFKSKSKGVRPRARYLEGSGATPQTRKRPVLAVSADHPEVRRLRLQARLKM